MELKHLIYAFINILNEMSPYILLGFLIAGLLQVFVSPARLSRHLAGGGWKPVFKAAMFGIPLPLCSCGVLPTAVALRRQGASKGASTSFLIATPQTGVDSIAATYALLGLPFAILRPIAALTGAFAGGLAVDKAERGTGMDSDENVSDECPDGSCCTAGSATPAPQGSTVQKLVAAVRYGFGDMVASVGKWLVIGLVIAAVITVAVPDTLFLSLSRYPVLAMLVMVAVAVPMYICATGSIPIALSLMLKGLSPGVAFVLLMAGPAANFASVMVLRKSLGARATSIYVGSVVVTAMAFGLLIDYLLPASWFTPFGSAAASTVSCHVELGVFTTACSVLLVALLVAAYIRHRKESRAFRLALAADANQQSTITNNINQQTTMKTVYTVEGMACNHCKATVEKAVGAVNGVTSVAVDLASGRVAVEGDHDAAQVAKAVADAGFTLAASKAE